MLRQFLLCFLLAATSTALPQTVFVTVTEIPTATQANYPPSLQSAVEKILPTVPESLYSSYFANDLAAATTFLKAYSSIVVHNPTYFPASVQSQFDAGLPSLATASADHILETAIPQSIQQLYSTNKAAWSSAFDAQFSGTFYPPWYSALPDNEKTFIADYSATSGNGGFVPTVVITKIKTIQPTTSSSSSSSMGGGGGGSSGLSTGAKAGIGAGIGGAAALALIIFIVWFCLRQRKKKNERKEAEGRVNAGEASEKPGVAGAGAGVAGAGAGVVGAGAAAATIPETKPETKFEPAPTHQSPTGQYSEQQQPGYYNQQQSGQPTYGGEYKGEAGAGAAGGAAAAGGLSPPMTEGATVSAVHSPVTETSELQGRTSVESERYEMAGSMPGYYGTSPAMGELPGSEPTGPRREELP